MIQTETDFEAMNTIQALTLTAPDGRELRTLAWFPTEECRRDFYAKAAKRGLTVTENK